uniref:Uncharacterized protein n=1 Tax=Citrobacter freundii TaxID=546 RepID=A0A2R4AKG6_CITFR|nr:hypothetical protein [Citrobacter freundii]
MDGELVRTVQNRMSSNATAGAVTNEKMNACPDFHKTSLM